jgi:hypothetical protein
VLLREFKAQRPQLGELIAIKYLGPPDDETAYHQYKVIVDRAAQNNLEPLGGEEPPPAQKTFSRAANAGPRNQQGVTVRRDGHSRQSCDDELGVSRADLPSQRPLVGVSR